MSGVLDFSILRVQTGNQRLHRSLKTSKHGLLYFVVFEVCSLRLSHSFPKQELGKLVIRSLGGQGALLALRPRCQKILSLLSSPLWLPQSNLSSMVTLRDLAVATWVNRKSLVASVGETWAKRYFSVPEHRLA